MTLLACREGDEVKSTIWPAHLSTPLWQDKSLLGETVMSRAEWALVCSRAAAQGRRRLIIFHFLLPAAMQGGKRSNIPFIVPRCGS